MRTIVLLLILLSAMGLTPAQSETSYNVYVPMLNITPKPMWGTEYYPGLISGSYRTLFERLAPEVIRLQLDWSMIEAVRGTYNWGTKLAADIAEAHSIGTKVMLTIKMAPGWAASDPTDCTSRIKDFTAWGQFVRAAVMQYPDVDYWEIGNEIDAPMGAGMCPYYGAWGDPNDAYYGGGYYAAVLNLATPIIHAAGKPVVFGGLMLQLNKPDMLKFLEGAILAGAEFDYYNFHQYAYHSQSWDTVTAHLYKAIEYIIGLQEKYNLRKPIWITETAYLCHGCPYEQDTPDNTIIDWDWQLQARWAALLQDAGAEYSEYIAGWLWYDGISNPWGSYCGMIYRTGQPKPVYEYLEDTR